MNALQELREKEEIPTKLELAILYYDNPQEYDEAGIGDAEAAASELAALRKELEEAKAENKKLKEAVQPFALWAKSRLPHIPHYKDEYPVYGFDGGEIVAGDLRRIYALDSLPK